MGSIKSRLDRAFKAIEGMAQDRDTIPPKLICVEVASGTEGRAQIAELEKFGLGVLDNSADSAAAFAELIGDRTFGDYESITAAELLRMAREKWGPLPEEAAQ